MSWNSAPSSTRFRVGASRPSSLPTLTAMSLIQRACEEVYSSFASSALARASTVERNVRSRLSKERALVRASFAWAAMPASRSSRRPSSVSLRRQREGERRRGYRRSETARGHTRRRASALKFGPTVFEVILAADHERIGLVRQQPEGARRQPVARLGVGRIVVVGPPAETLEPGVVVEGEPERGSAEHRESGPRPGRPARRPRRARCRPRARARARAAPSRHGPRAAPLRRGVRSRRQPRHARRAPRESGGRRCRTGRCPSFDSTSTPTTFAPYRSGTARSDSSIRAVPSM